MSTTIASFQLFPLDGVAAPAVTASVIIAFLALTALYVVRMLRTRALTRAAGELGLNEPCAKFVGKALVRSPGTPESLVSSAARLREALARRLGTITNDTAADRFAINAAWCLSQLGCRDAPFEGAPKTFDAVQVGDPVDSSPTFTAYIADVDETSLTLITSRACPYPPHTPLTLTLEDDSKIETTLELKPVTAAPEWVLAHTLDANVERRETHRTPCSVNTVSLEPCAEVVEMRRALRLRWPLSHSDLEDNEIWRHRRRMRIIDISPGGAAVLVDEHVPLGERFHLLLSGADDSVLAVPEVEVLHTHQAPTGELRLGVRFIGVRLAERTAICDWIGANGEDNGLAEHASALASSVGAE